MTGLRVQHKVVDPREVYVDGTVHTNRLENFWSLLKRAIKGTYVSIEPFHLFRYLDEQSFRYNERKATDAERFHKVLGCVGGKAPDLRPGEGVTRMPEQKDKAEEESQSPKPKKPPGYRKFEKLLSS